MLLDQDHIRWKSWKLIAWSISPTPSFFVAQRPSIYSQRNMGKFLGRLEVGWEKVACRSTKAAITLKRVKIDEKLLWRAYTNSQTLSNCTIPDPLRPPILQDWGSQPTPKLQSLLSQERLKLWTANLADTFTGSIRTQAYEKFWRKGSVGVSRDGPHFLSTQYYLRNG